MPRNRIVHKRTSTSGLLPNTTNSANSAYIAAGELAVNLTDFKVLTSNGSSPFEVGANLNSLYVGTGNVTINATALKLGTATLVANGSNGTSGQVLTSNGTATYWSTAGGGSFSNGTAYTWSAEQTFNANVLLTGNSTNLIKIGSGISSNVNINSTAIALSASAPYNIIMDVDVGNIKIDDGGSGVIFEIDAQNGDVLFTNDGYSSSINRIGLTGSITLGSNFSGTATPVFHAEKAYMTIGNSSINVSSNSSTLSVGSQIAINATAIKLGSSALFANGSNGTSGQVLTSNGTSAYWATSTGGGLGDSFETVNKNLKAYAAVYSYSAGRIANIV